jgi:hypothetical protein
MSTSVIPRLYRSLSSRTLKKDRDCSSVVFGSAWVVGVGGDLSVGVSIAGVVFFIGVNV